MAKYLDTKSGSLEEAIKKVNEKSVSQAQQKAAGAALSAKRGEISPSELVGASKEMHDNMTEKELEDFAKTKHKDLPKKIAAGHCTSEEVLHEAAEIEFDPKDFKQTGGPLSNADVTDTVKRLQKQFPGIKGKKTGKHTIKFDHRGTSDMTKAGGFSVNKLALALDGMGFSLSDKERSRSLRGIRSEYEPQEEARQLKDPKKETMVVKNKKVEVIDKKDLKKYLSKGYMRAEETELEEVYYDVVFKDKRGKVEKDGKGFKDKAKAQRYADAGNKIKGVQGTYVVYTVKGKPDKVLEDLDGDDKVTVQKVADKLKKASEKHANQAKSLEKDIQDNLDKVNPDAVKKKFADRKDKDIDNDGDVDSTDKYLHKRRKAISKAVAKEEVVKEYNEIGTPEYTKHTLEVTPGQQDADWDKQVNVMHKKSNSMREALAKVWGMKEGKSPFEKEEDKNSKKTMTGEKTTKVEVEPNIKK